MESRLQALLRQAADKALADGINRDNMDSDNPGGPLVRWMWRNCQFSEEQCGLLLMLLAAELADRAAQAEGFSNQAERAAHRAFARAGGAA